jgi:hypothetical protein
VINLLEENKELIRGRVKIIITILIRKVLLLIKRIHKKRDLSQMTLNSRDKHNRKSKPSMYLIRTNKTILKDPNQINKFNMTMNQYRSLRNLQRLDQLIRK